MRKNRFNEPLRKAAFVGMISLFCAGVGLWAYGQPAAHAAHSVSNHPNRAVHSASVRARYVRVGYVHGRAVYQRAALYGRTGVYGRRPVHRAAARAVYAPVNVHVAVHPVYPPYPADVAWYTHSVYPLWYPYGYYLYQTDLSAQGYSDGFHRGQDDAEDHRAYDPYRKGYRNPGSPTYDAGFLTGYAAGYGR